MCFLGDFDIDVALDQLRPELAHKFLDNLGHRFGCQRIERHASIESISKLGAERASECAVIISTLIPRTEIPPKNGQNRPPPRCSS